MVETAPHSAARRSRAPGHGRVLEFIAEQGITTRRAIGTATGLTQPTVTRIVQDLMDQGLVREGEKLHGSGAGRRPSELELVPDAAMALGVHITATRLELGLVGLGGDVVARIELPIRPGEPEALARQVREGYDRLLSEHGLEPERVLGAGVGMAGVVDRKGGTNRFAFNLAWKDVPVRQMLASSLELPVAVETNTRAMAVGERRFGLGRTGTRNFLFFLVGSGVGSALILNGRLHRGTGIAGEIGHTSIDPHGPRCNCGGNGCLELYVAEPYILKEASSLVAPGAALDALEDVARNLEAPDLTERLEHSGRLIGSSLAHAVDLLDLDAVVLEGQLFSLMPVTTALKTHLQQASMVARLRHLDVTVSSLGRSIGVVGSASLVLDRFFRSPLSGWGAHKEAVR